MVKWSRGIVWDWTLGNHEEKDQEFELDLRFCRKLIWQGSRSCLLDETVTYRKAFFISFRLNYSWQNLAAPSPAWWAHVCTPMGRTQGSVRSASNEGIWRSFRVDYTSYKEVPYQKSHLPKSIIWLKSFVRCSALKQQDMHGIWMGKIIQNILDAADANCVWFRIFLCSLRAKSALTQLHSLTWNDMAVTNWTQHANFHCT